MNNNLILLQEKLNSTNSNERYDAIIDIGKGEHRQLQPEVIKFLSHNDSEARRAAIIVLGTHWQVPEVIDTLENLWRNDPEELVRVAALIAWSGYFAKTKNKPAMKKLFQILIDDVEELQVLIEALAGIFRISGLELSQFGLANIYRINDFDEFKSKVPWDELDKIMN